MNTQDLIIKRAAMKVEAAMKGAEMIKEVPGHIMSNIQDEIDPETIAIIEQLFGGAPKEASLNKIAAAPTTPGFHEKLWNLGKSVFRNVGRSAGTFAGDTSKDAWKNLGSNLWNGHTTQGIRGLPGIGIKDGFRAFGNIVSQHPWPTMGYGALGAAGLTAGLTAAGAAGLYAGHKILS